MRLNIAIFFGALFGALGVLLFLVAFGSDYWLLVTEVGSCPGEQNIENVTFHHEGFFWRCWFSGVAEENGSNIWKFWYTNQPSSKNCTHAYLSPYPLTRGDYNSTAYDSAVRDTRFTLAVLALLACVVHISIYAGPGSELVKYFSKVWVITNSFKDTGVNTILAGIYRGFWAVLMLLGTVTVVTASFLIICAAPFASHFLYKVGGGSYIAAGFLFSLVVILYVIWVQAVADMETYTSMKMKDCLAFSASVLYGWSFFLAPAGIFFSCLAGLLFLIVGRHIQLHH